MNIIRKLTAVTTSNSFQRSLSVSAANNANYSCKLLVVGGGSGGCTIAAKFARRLPKDSVIVLEPSAAHYYQPLWTLVGAGISRMSDTLRSARSVLPTNAKWLKDAAATIDPRANCVKTRDGHVINYEYVVIAVGLQNDYCKIPGLTEALEDKNSSVSTIFDVKYAEKTYSNLQAFRGGEAVFTYPDSPIKCPGAPQKIVYLAESYFTKSGVRSKSTVTYNTCLPVIFGVKKYADALLKVVERKNIHVNYKTVLKELRHDRKEAVFVNKDTNNECTMSYDMLHVSPPMKTPPFLCAAEGLCDVGGYLNVDKYTLQSVAHPNVFGLGDCTNTPNSKTAAAIAKQSFVLEQNLLSVMQKDSPKEKYNGYGACPLVTSYSTVILAEFLYDGVPHETMPFDQAQESRIAFYMKKHLFPFMYWNFMLKGNYHGPEFIRSIINPLAK